MADERGTVEARRLWQDHENPEEAIEMTTAELAERAEALQTRVRRRNRLEYAAALLVAVVFAAYCWTAPGWITRVGAGLVVLGTALVAHALHRRGGARALPGDPAVDWLAFQRRELVRQRDLLRDVWRWYLGPLVPGLAMFLAGIAVEVPGAGVPALLTAAGTAGVFALIWLLNARAAARLQRQIEMLDAEAGAR